MFDLNKFDEYRENNRLEVKTAKHSLPVSLWDTYSAFANSYGGVIILGVKERADKSWVASGIDDIVKTQKSFWDTINNPTKVSLNLLTDKDVKIYKAAKDADIMVISVPAAKREQKPVYINDDLFKGTFRRNWEGDYRCTKDEVKALLRDQTDDTYDMTVLVKASMDDFNYETVHSYRNRHQLLNAGHPFEGYTDPDYLEHIGAAAISEDNGKLYPTAAGLLMFGNEYRIIRQFPDYFLDYREVLDPEMRWTDRLQSSSGDWSGNLCDFYFRVYNKIQSSIKVPFTMSGGDRIDDTPVHKAVREALANCLINADYFGKYGIVIKKEQDCLILENPGYIRVGINQMIHGGKSDPRNKTLMKMFNMINVGERAGSGVPNILQTWEKENWPEPEIEETFGPDRTVFTLSFVSRTTQSTTQTTQATQATTQATQAPRLSSAFDAKDSVYGLVDIELDIINLFKKHPEYSQTSVARELNIDINLVKYYVRKLREKGLVSREGTSQKGVWIVEI